MTSSPIRVTSRADWFEPARSVTVPSNATLEQIVRLAEVPQWVLEFGTVAIHGNVIDRKYWRNVYPKDGAVITIHPPALHGGGGQSGSKQVLTIVSTIALIAGAA
jgi:hypothetical protein